MTHTDQRRTRPEDIVAYFEDFWDRQLAALKRFAEERDQSTDEATTQGQEGVG